VLNKIDQLPNESILNGLRNRYPNAIPISAKQQHGFESFAFRVSDALSRTFRDVDVETGVDNGRLMAYLAAHGEVLSKQFDGQHATLHCRIAEKFLGRINEPGTVIRPRDEVASIPRADAG
jgi:GTPase